MRIPPSERTSQQLGELLSHGVADGDARVELLKLAVRRIVEEALEAEVAEVLGREHYVHGASSKAIREELDWLTPSAFARR